MQLTPRSKKVIDLAYDEARQLDNNYIGTEHLLLGMLREGEGLAGRVLLEMGIRLEQVRAVICHLQNNASAGCEDRAGDLSGIKENLERLKEAIKSKVQERSNTYTALDTPIPADTGPKRGDVGGLKIATGSS